MSWGPRAEPLVGLEGAKPPENFLFFIAENFALRCKVGVQMRVEVVGGQKVSWGPGTEPLVGVERTKPPENFPFFYWGKHCSEMQSTGADEGRSRRLNE